MGSKGSKSARQSERKGGKRTSDAPGVVAAVKKTQSSSFLRRWRTWIALAVVAVLGVGACLGVSWWRQSSFARRLPALPELSGQPKLLIEQLTQVDRAARAKPTNAAVVGELAMAYHGDVFYDQASICYSLCEELDGKDWRWKYYQALLREERGQSQAVVVKLKEVVALKPDHALAWFRLGEAYAKQDQHELARQAYVQAQRTDPPRSRIDPNDTARNRTLPVSAYATLGLARLAARQGQQEQALHLLEPLTQAQSRWGPAHRLLGQVHEALGHAKEAEERIRFAAAQRPYVPPADPMVDELSRRSRSATFLLKQYGLAENAGDGAWSEVLALRALESNPNDMDALGKLGLLLVRYNRPQEALTYLEKHHQVNPDSIEGVIWLGNCYWNIGRRADAESLLRKTIERFPADSSLQVNLGTILADLNRPAEAEQALRKGVELDPGSPEPHRRLGRILADRKQFDEAIRECSQAIALRSNDWQIHSEFGAILTLAGRLPEAIAQYREALFCNPGDPVTWENLVRALYHSEQFEQAYQAAQRLAEVSPDKARAHMLCAELAVKLGRADDARLHCGLAVQLQPNLAPAAQKLQESLPK